MKKLLVAAALFSVIATSASAACQEDIDMVAAAFQASSLSEDDQGKVAEAIDAATEAVADGNEEACAVALMEAKSLLGME